jgi:threonine synthase
MGFSISDEQILAAQQKLSSSTGIFAEPAAAAAYAGFLQAASQNIFKPDDQVVVLITGTGLKDIPNAQKNLVDIEPVTADMPSVEHYLESD